jgi:hypothetical protein
VPFKDGLGHSVSVFHTHNHGWTRSIGGWRIFSVGLAVLLGIPVYIPHLWVC